LSTTQFVKLVTQMMSALVGQPSGSNTQMDILAVRTALFGLLVFKLIAQPTVK